MITTCPVLRFLALFIALVFTSSFSAFLILLADLTAKSGLYFCLSKCSDGVPKG